MHSTAEATGYGSIMYDASESGLMGPLTPIFGSAKRLRYLFPEVHIRVPISKNPFKIFNFKVPTKAEEGPRDGDT